MTSYLIFAAVFVFGAACAASTDSALTAAELSGEFARSPKLIRDKFDGKEVMVTGTVAAEATVPVNEAAEGLIVLVGPDGKDDLPLNCRFTRKEVHRFKQLTIGQIVTVTGVFNGELGTDLRFCRQVRRENAGTL